MTTCPSARPGTTAPAPPARDELAAACGDRLLEQAGGQWCAHTGLKYGHPTVADLEAEELVDAVLPGEGRDDLGAPIPANLVDHIAEEADDRMLRDPTRYRPRFRLDQAHGVGIEFSERNVAGRAASSGLLAYRSNGVATKGQIPRPWGRADGEEEAGSRQRR